MARPPENAGLTDRAPRHFAMRLALFYAALFGLVGTHLPFFPLWLTATGLDAGWIGVISAVPSVARFTVLPLVTAAAERRRAIRGALRLAALGSVLGFAALGALQSPMAILVLYALTACLFTPMMPLTDAYALKAVKRYALDYGPLRLWGSAAFIVGALACGGLVQIVDARHVIWVIAAVAALGVVAGLGLMPIDVVPAAGAVPESRVALLRDPGFLAIIAASALTQGSHAAYYTFASIGWARDGLDGLSIAGLWTLGVLAEIVLFALSPRFTWHPAWLVVLAAAIAAARWTVMALSPPPAVLVVVQLLHGFSFGLTMVATMALLVRHVPIRAMARAQGALAAATGIVMGGTAAVSGLVYRAFGDGLYGAMAAMALAAAVIMTLGRRRAGVPMSAAAAVR